MIQQPGLPGQNGDSWSHVCLLRSYENEWGEARSTRRWASVEFMITAQEKFIFYKHRYKYRYKHRSRVARSRKSQQQICLLLHLGWSNMCTFDTTPCAGSLWPDDTAICSTNSDPCNEPHSPVLPLHLNSQNATPIPFQFLAAHLNLQAWPRLTHARRHGSIHLDEENRQSTAPTCMQPMGPGFENKGKVLWQ